MGCLEVNFMDEVSRDADVPQVLLDLDLSSDLLLYSTRNDLALVQAFQRNDEVRWCFSASKVDSTEFALA